jgi:glycosyltransferase involved in cell wall biosynthesis
MNMPLVSVCILTYQHRDYIKQCLDSVLMQETAFTYEVCIGEDESSDGTREICVDYAKKYPDKIKLFLRNRADVICFAGHPTGRYNLLETLKQCRGKYIALCEGDDYWIDPLKLAKQVDFMESSVGYSGCQHRTMITVDDGNGGADHVQFCQQEELSLHDVLARNFFASDGYNVSRTHTSSLLFQREIISSGFPEEFYECSQGDHFLYVLVTIHGKIRILPDVMSVYRVHGQGLSAKIGLGNYHDKEMRRTQFLRMYDLFQKIVPQGYFYEIEYIKKGLRLFFENEDAKRTFAEHSKELTFRHALWVWENYVQRQYAEIALWGAGSHTKDLLRRLGEKRLRLPRVIFDHAAQNTTMDGVPVKKPQVSDHSLFDGIVFSSMIYQKLMLESIRNIFGDGMPCIDLYEGLFEEELVLRDNQIATI